MMNDSHLTKSFLIYYVNIIFVDNYSYQESRIVQDGKLITSRGPGTSFEFAFAIMKELCGKEVVEKTREPMQIFPAIEF